MRQRKRSCGRRQREPVEAEERRGPGLQRPEIVPAFCEWAHRRKKLSAHEDAAGAPVERDNQARPGSAAAHVFHGGEEPVARVGQVRRLSADKDPALHGSGGEIETEERSVADGCPRVGERQPERIAPSGQRARMAWHAQRRGHAARGHVLAGVMGGQENRPDGGGDDRRQDDCESESVASRFARSRRGSCHTVHHPPRWSGIPANSGDSRENPEPLRERCATIAMCASAS